MTNLLKCQNITMADILAEHKP